MIKGRTNQGFFANLKAQSWWSLRQRLQATPRAIESGRADDPDALISIRTDLAELHELLQELAQVAYQINAAGKVVVVKAPAGFKSPDLADEVCVAFAPIHGIAELWIKLVAD
jgi:phage terminase large subunit